ncbi:hypothetical protein [Brevibacillus agri]|uniref:hypothetical protein n=1 Tax=Brevibacillus agri TaxID=51101 RepID=UPI0018CEE792|nr:hypothetical protein [Brevibacillus agri]MBG9568483.1 hypothetical protein [Brevibacillus agri]
MKGLTTFLYEVSKQEVSVNFDVLFSVFDDAPAIHGYASLNKAELLGILENHSFYANEVTAIGYSEDSWLYYTGSPASKEKHHIIKNEDGTFIKCYGIGVTEDEPIQFDSEILEKIRVRNREDLNQLYGLYICSPKTLLRCPVM